MENGKQEKRSEKQPAEQNPQPQPPAQPDYLFRIKPDGSWEMPTGINPYMLPTLLRRAANQLEKRLTEAP